MEVHKIELIVIDFDAVGAKGVKEVIEHSRYPNRCISPDVRSIDTRDCGEWTDKHPLNYITTFDAALAEPWSGWRPVNKIPMEEE